MGRGGATWSICGLSQGVGGLPLVSVPGVARWGGGLRGRFVGVLRLKRYREARNHNAPEASPDVERIVREIAGIVGARIYADGQ